MSYSELTRRYFEAAPGAGVLEGPGVLRGAAGSRTHGTWVQFDVKVAAGSIETARFLAFACPHIIAVSAWVVEHVVGRTAQAILPESVQELSARFDVPVEKRGRLLIVEDAWRNAFEGRH